MALPYYELNDWMFDTTEAINKQIFLSNFYKIIELS